jgi:polysaccharide pyruvyl transferase CsaB
MKNIVISGYYGHDNFGDDAILKVITSEIKKHIITPHITVLSANPEATRAYFRINSIYKYDFIKIISRISNCDIFISGGGSLFQDVTSLKSLVYYLFLIITAKLFKKKVYVFGQGIGPLRTFLGRFLAKKVLKLPDLITVRDEESSEILKTLDINSTVTADPVWLMRYPLEQAFPGKYHRTKLGIQLRNWPSLNKEKLTLIAEAVISCFDMSNTSVQLLSLQDSQDKKVLKDFQTILREKSPEIDVKLFCGLTIERNVFFISEMDYIISMRYHANLIAVSNCVPALAVAYDPKVENFSKETGIPCISIDKLNLENFKELINKLISDKDNIKSGLCEISLKKSRLAEQNIVLLNTLFEKTLSSNLS